MGRTEDFRTHANYVRAFAMLCAEPYGPPADPWFAWSSKALPGILANLAPRVAASPSMRPPTNAQPDLAQTQASLKNAWGTELLLAFGRQLDPDEDLVRLMNNWAVVQAYYVGYHATQALTVARGHPRPESHRKTQGQFATFWAHRTLDLPPWSLGSSAGASWENPPPGGIRDSLNPWTTCDSRTCWHLAAKALRTTREEAVRGRIQVAKDKKYTERKKAADKEEAHRIAKGKDARPERRIPKPNLSPAEKQAQDDKVRTHTVLDYLYRLRIKTNYLDAAMFIDGPDDSVSSSRVHRDLVALASSTMLVHELHVGAVIGKTTLLTWVDDWLKRNAVSDDLGLGLRRDAIARHL